MQKLSKLLLSVLFMPFLASSSYAVSYNYLEGQFGLSSYGDTSFTDVGTVNPSIRGSVGHLWGQSLTGFNYGVETGLFYGPDFFLFGDDDSSATAVDALGVAKYTAHSGIDVFAKAGLAYIHSRLKLDDFFGLSETGTSNTVAPEAAIGMGYQFANWGVDLTFDRIFGGNMSDSNFAGTVQTIGLGVSYRFT